MSFTNEKGMINWYLTQPGVMRVEGAGRIADCDCGENPPAAWAGVKDSIREIHIMEGVTVIGVNAFRDFGCLTRVVLPHSVERIGARAFWGCRQLTRLESDRGDFRYVYDRRPSDADDTVVFGLDAFHEVPWSRARWGDFYIREGRLYAAFPGPGAALAVPEGVRALEPFSMNHLNLAALTLPDTLEAIGDFAFSGSTVGGTVRLPGSVKRLDHFALADCSILWEDCRLLRELHRGTRRLGKAQRERFPIPFRKYSLVSVRRKAYGDFRLLRIKENKPPKRKDGAFRSYILDTRFDAGSSLYRRLRRGAVVLGVICRDDRVASVEAFVSFDDSGLLDEYLMYPEYSPEDGVLPWRDSFTCQEKDDFLCAFDEVDAAQMMKAKSLRPLDSGDLEEWFLSLDKGNYGGPLELDLLEKWLPLHPGIAVDSSEENRQKDPHRFLVPI